MNLLCPATLPLTSFSTSVRHLLKQSLSTWSSESVTWRGVGKLSQLSWHWLSESGTGAWESDRDVKASEEGGDAEITDDKLISEDSVIDKAVEDGVIIDFPELKITNFNGLLSVMKMLQGLMVL